MWTAVTQSNVNYQNWQSVAMNYDSSRLVACVNGGGIWLNTDGTWIDVTQTIQPWTCVAMNYVGNCLYACANDIWKSTDGVTWLPLHINKTWTSIHCDYTGQHVFATASNAIPSDPSSTGGGIWYSGDGGSTWQSMMLNKNWQTISCDSTGTTILAAIKGGDIWLGNRSTSIQWTSFGIPYQNWRQVAVNANGNLFLACVSGGDLWKSYGDGNWHYSNNIQNWRSVAMDASGQHLFACANGNDIWTSQGGAWIKTGMTYKNWTCIACDVSGLNAIACETNLWLNITNPPGPEPGPTGPTGSTGPYADICFMKDTLVQTDQGEVRIQHLIPGKHTLFKQYIIAVTVTIHTDSHVVKVSAYAFGSYPTKDTYVSRNHKINGKDSFLEAQEYVNGTSVILVPYHRDPLYNVLCERPAFMKVHGMMAETLDPQSDIALHHKSKRYQRLK